MSAIPTNSESKEKQMAKERQDLLKLLATLVPDKPKPKAKEKEKPQQQKEPKVKAVSPLKVPPKSEPEKPKPKENEKPVPKEVSLSTKLAAIALPKEATFRPAFQIEKEEILNQDYVNICIADKVSSDQRVSLKCPKAALQLKVDAFKERTYVRGYINLEVNNPFYTWFCNWLLRDPPLLIELGTVLPLLKIADELKLIDLREKCLTFWKNHVNDINYVENDWTSIDKSTMLIFARMFTNQELASAYHQSDLQNYLYQQFILFLNEPTPKNHLGHYASTSNLFQCKHCGKLLSSDVKGLTNCQMFEVNRTGAAEPKHKRDSDWSLSGMLARLRRNFWSWKMVYWRLWGSCHYVSCSVCSQLFPLSQMNWCRYHLQEKAAALLDSTLPQPSQPCCSKATHPFEIIPSKTGCKYRHHVPVIDTPVIAKILEIYYENQILIDMEACDIEPDTMRMTQPIASEPSLIDKKLFISAKKQKKYKSKKWTLESSVTWNQDNQRELEEKWNKDIERFLTQKCCRESSYVSPKPLGGAYVLAEREWYEFLGLVDDEEEEIEYSNRPVVRNH